MTAVNHLQPQATSNNPPTVPRLNLEGLDSDEDRAARQPHPLDLLDSYDFEASGKDTGIGPSFHSDRRSQHTEPLAMEPSANGREEDRSEASGARGGGDEDNRNVSPSNQSETEESVEVPIDLADPEDVSRKLASINFTEEEEEELLQQAYKMNQLLRQRLSKMTKSEKKRGGGRGTMPAPVLRAQTMYEGNAARVGPVKKLPPLPRHMKAAPGGARPPLPHPPTNPKKSAGSKRPSRSLEGSAAGRGRVLRPEWNERFTSDL